jgi:hypothetical protein
LHNPKLNGAYPELVEGVKFLFSIFRTKKFVLFSKFLDSALRPPLIGEVVINPPLPNPPHKGEGKQHDEG